MTISPITSPVLTMGQDDRRGDPELLRETANSPCFCGANGDDPQGAEDRALGRAGAA